MRLHQRALLLALPWLAGFAEDSTMPSSSVSKSSTHYDLVLALGRCAGMTSTNAQTMANYSEATDVGKFNGVSLNFTGRTSANADYFHAPQLMIGSSLDELAKWSSPAQLGKRYVPAGLPSPTLQVAQLSGTIGAFGVYLHAIGDRYSHKACIDAGYVPHCNGPGLPACTSPTEVELCGFGAGGTETSAHVLEFSDPKMTPNTLAGLQQMYLAIAARLGRPSSIPAKLEAVLEKYSTTADAAARVTLAQSITIATCSP